MRMTRVTRAIAIVLVVVALTAAGRLIDATALTGGIQGDEATYMAMAVSLAEDHDLKYAPVDYYRFTRLFGTGPSGIFLKRSYAFSLTGEPTPIPATTSLSYGKALIYPLAAAPFFAIGGSGGLLIFNLLLVALCVWCAATYCGAILGRTRGWLAATVFMGASVAPLFALFLTSDVFNFALVFVAYFLWLYKKVAPAGAPRWLTGSGSTLFAALLLGVAMFSKATNAALIAPLAVDLLLQRQFKLFVVGALAFTLGVAGLFGANAVITGEANYQGARGANDRRSFHDSYPFDEKGTTFDVSGTTMQTDDADTDRVLATDELVHLPANIGYFLFGRHAGLVPYYFPGVLIAVLWLVRLRQAALWQWAVALTVVGSCGALILFLPDSWNGGGGPPGNRYFLSLYPPLLFLIGPAFGLGAAITGLAVGGAFTGAMLMHPVTATAKPYLNVERPPLRWLPIELTLINDLPVRLNQLRGSILFEREPWVLFYYMDGNTYSAEGDGTWLAGHATAEIVIRTDRPIKRVTMSFTAPIDNEISGDFAGKPFTASVGENKSATVQIAKPDWFRYHQSYAYVLRVTTTAGFVPAIRTPGEKDTRNLGVFIRPKFEIEEGR